MLRLVIGSEAHLVSILVTCGLASTRSPAFMEEDDWRSLAVFVHRCHHWLGLDPSGSSFGFLLLPKMSPD